MSTNILPILLLGGAAFFLMSRGEDEDGDSPSEDDGVYSKECFEFIRVLPPDPQPQGSNSVGSFVIGSSSYVQTQRQIIKETVLTECARINKFSLIDIGSVINSLSLSTMTSEQRSIIERSGTGSPQAILSELKSTYEEMATKMNMTAIVGMRSAGEGVRRIIFISSVSEQISAEIEGTGSQDFIDMVDGMMGIAGGDRLPHSGDVEISSLSNSDANTIEAVKGAIKDSEITGA